MMEKAAVEQRPDRGRFGAGAEVPRFGDRISSAPDLSARLLAMTFWAASLTPTLLPRSAMIQGALTGGLTVIGYGLCRLLLGAFRLQCEHTGFSHPAAEWRRVGGWFVVH